MLPEPDPLPGRGGRHGSLRFARPTRAAGAPRGAREPTVPLWPQTPPTAGRRVTHVSLHGAGVPCTGRPSFGLGEAPGALRCCAGHLPALSQAATNTVTSLGAQSTCWSAAITSDPSSHPNEHRPAPALRNASRQPSGQRQHGPSPNLLHKWWAPPTTFQMPHEAGARRTAAALSLGSPSQSWPHQYPALAASQIPLSLGRAWESHLF